MMRSFFRVGHPSRTVSGIILACPTLDAPSPAKAIDPA
jgi:hypothetical protein